MEIRNSYTNMSENHEVILTTKWWENLRYFHFGSDLAERFHESPELQTDLRDLFKAQNDKLSYYDLF